MSGALPDDDLSRLSSEDLERVCSWIEDRMINSIAALATRLQIAQDLQDRGKVLPPEMLVHLMATARQSVRKVMGHVEDIRGLARAQRSRGAG